MTTLVNNDEEAISQGVYAFEVTGALDLQMRLESTFTTIKDASFSGADSDLIELPATTLKVINGGSESITLKKVR